MTDSTSDKSETGIDTPEPSMEDILASIRQLIADDDAVDVAEEGHGDDAIATLAVPEGLTNTLVADEEPLELVNAIMDDADAKAISDMAPLEAFVEPVMESDNAALEIPEIDIVDADDVMTSSISPAAIDEEIDISVSALANDMMTDTALNEGDDLDVPDADSANISPAGEAGGDSLMDDLMGDILGDGTTAPGGVDIASAQDVSDEVLNGFTEMEHTEGTAPTDIDFDNLLSKSDADIPNISASDGLDDVDTLLDDLAGDMMSEPEDALVQEVTVPDIDTASPAEVTAIANDIDTEDFDALLDGLTGDVDVQDTPAPLETLSDPDAFDDIDAMMSDVDVPYTNADNIDAGTDNVDPDIALVKSLMAELTDIPSDDISLNEDLAGGTSPTSEHIELAAPSEVVSDEDDILSDLLEDTIASEEGLQADVQSDIDAQLAALQSNIDDSGVDAPIESGEQAQDSNLAALADMLDPGDGADLSMASESDGKAVIGAAAVSTLAAAAAPKLSALDNLLGDEDGADDGEDNFDLSDLLIDTPESAAHASSQEDIDIEDMLADITEDNIDVTGSVETGDKDLGDALAGLLEDDLGTELNVPELDVLDEILSEDTAPVVDESPETVDIIIETSQTETEDMAGKTARETILDEVTETAAASAFASLNQVVDEKNIVEERGDRIGDLVTEALKPMLKEWLDKNLKTIVERAVTKEVKRISSGK